MTYEFGDGYQQLKDPGFEYDPNAPGTYEQQFYAWRLTRDTKECDISTYPGTGDQQSTRPTPPAVSRKATAAELCRRIRRR